TDSLIEVMKGMTDYLIGVIEGILSSYKLKEDVREKVYGLIIPEMRNRIKKIEKAIYALRKSWKKIGKTEKGEDIYYNLATKEVGIEKDHSYLVEPET
ncbi:MAG: hypothetical protein J7L39_00465, partial [Candidatus Aenigmarchaeota archaeon]|nr:hypothetical protein [Candidatus Aenigmarchaeota archaeon]